MEKNDKIDILMTPQLSIFFERLEVFKKKNTKYSDIKSFFETPI